MSMSMSASSILEPSDTLSISDDDVDDDGDDGINCIVVLLMSSVGELDVWL